MTTPFDPNRPIDGSGPSQVFYVDPSATRTVADGVTNSTKTVTSATAAFTDSDTGKTISGTGIPYLAIIASVQSATSVTLSVAATASASGVTITIGGHYPSQKFEDTEAVFGQQGLLPPVQSATSTSTTGGTLAAATYFYKITAVGQGAAGGETTGSNERSQITSGSTSTVTLTWSAVPNATAYNVYRSTTTNTEVFLTKVTGAVTLIDTGSISPGTATVPTANTAVYYSPTDYQASTYITNNFDGGFNEGTSSQTQDEVSVNDRVVTDGVLNSTATVTSATAAFTSGDVGNGIVATGIPVDTYIKAVNSATNITLSAAATASATGVTLTIGLPFVDSQGYGYTFAPSKPNAPVGAPHAANVEGLSYQVSADDTTGAVGHTASFGAAVTYGQSLVTGAVDQQFGAESNFPGTAGPGASGGVFTAAGSGTVGAATANPITGVPDTLGTSGGTAGVAGVPIPSSYSITGGNELGSNAVVNGYPLFVTDGFDTPGSSGVRTTTNTNFNHVGLTDTFGAITTTPLGYVLTSVDTIYGYPGLVAGSTGQPPTKPLSVSWVYGAGCAIVSWSPPSSTGGSTIREYIVVGYRVLDDSYIPLTVQNGANFTSTPDVTWKDKGGTFLTAPVQSAIVGSTSGGTLAAGTRFYVVTALGVNGETLASNERTVVNTGSTSSNVIAWAAVTGAVSYNVYRGTATGAEVLLKNVAGVTYTDTNADTAGTAVPPSSPTAVTPTTSARVEHLEPGSHYFFRVYCRNDVGTSPMSDPVAGPVSPNNVPKYFMGLGMSAAVNTELDESALITAEFAADRL